ncbi:MAG: lipopolysaccharide transport system ATP-binding protein [Gammaproteobacteria bacterium]
MVMNAAIIGISPEVIAEKLSEIEEFANIGEHIDHPVKTYSSGMFVRLAFATSIHMEPEILIVDEALAVGDISFQRKCFREFERFKRDGKTILFVTHAVDLISSYCDSAVFLHQGEIKAIGEPKQVVYEYLDMMFGSKEEESARKEAVSVPTKKSSDSTTISSTSLILLNTDPSIDGAKFRRSYNHNEYRWGGTKAKIIDYQLLANGEFDPVVVPQSGKLTVSMKVHFFEALEDIIYGITIKTLDGVTVYGANTRERQIETQSHQPGEQTDIQFDLKLNLLRGNYFVSLGVAQMQDNETDNIAVDRRYDLFSIAIHGESRDFGLANLEMAFSES